MRLGGTLLLLGLVVLMSCSVVEAVPANPRDPQPALAERPRFPAHGVGREPEKATAAAAGALCANCGRLMIG
jgi:hypothetical protein